MLFVGFPNELPAVPNLLPSLLYGKPLVPALFWVIERSGMVVGIPTLWTDVKGKLWLLDCIPRESGPSTSTSGEKLSGSTL
jgi:hypothetical protein